MEARLLLLLLLLLLVHILLISSIIPGTKSTNFVIQNNCPYTIWPATSPTSGSTAPLSTTGFVLPQGSSSTLDAPSGWAGRIWARTLCSTNSSSAFLCSVGDCGTGQLQCNGSTTASQPVTLLEFTINGASNLDFYDISLVDGFNIPVTITPRDSACKSVGCTKDINTVCPWQMTVKDAGGSAVVACKSACSVFNTPAYCCTGNYSSPANCTSDFALVFKSQCPDVFSLPFDDQSSMFVCPTGGDYFITFCPSSARTDQLLGMLCY